MHVAEVPEPEAPTDLIAALRASVEAARTRRGGESGLAERDGDLAELPKDELYRRAKEADIPGRADMSKKELIEALRAA